LLNALRAPPGPRPRSCNPLPTSFTDRPNGGARIPGAVTRPG